MPRILRKKEKERNCDKELEDSGGLWSLESFTVKNQKEQERDSREDSNPSKVQVS